MAQRRYVALTPLFRNGLIMVAPPPKVFISYSHDTPEHKTRVLAFANALRDHGVDAEIDQYQQRPPQGWPRWCEEQLRAENSDFVLMICTQIYRERIEGRAPPDVGRGVYWEGDSIYNYIYNSKEHGRFIPVLLPGATEQDVPQQLQGAGRYDVTAFDQDDPCYVALYRLLVAKPEIVKPALGKALDLSCSATPALTLAALPPRAVRTAFDVVEPAEPLASPFDISRIASYAPENLIGRETETTLIDDAFAAAVRDDAKRARVLAFVAMGGEGKTALVADWAARKEVGGWPDLEAAFAWSFYSQGSRDQYAGSSDLFLAAALKHFGVETKEGEGAVEKAKRLAKLIGEKRALLILDGLEPLQYPAGPPHDGRLKDDAMLALLRALAVGGKALTLITTRVKIEELKSAALQSVAPQHDLAHLSPQAGAALLAALGVKGSKDEYGALVKEVQGHALTLNVLGTYLKCAFHGDIRLFDRVEWERASQLYKNNHAFRAMAAYETFLSQGDAGGAREIAILRLMGLFDRPADAGCWNALLADKIENLNEALIDAREDEREIALDNLVAEKLLTVERDASGALVALDAHPLLREYFAKELREKNPQGWRAAHERIFRHLCATETDKGEAPTLDDLRPLYQAVAHGCHAGLQQEACREVYIKRILRGTGDNGFYSVRKLGVFGADLGAVACFFEAPWTRLSLNLLSSSQSWLLNQAASHLRALGRLREAQEPMRAALGMLVDDGDWRNAAAVDGNLSELAVALGDVAEAVGVAADGVNHAEHSRDAFWRLGSRTSYADARHQAGQRAEALGLFINAEEMQAALQPLYPLLYSLQGFRYCDLLLGAAERAAWARLIGATPPSLGGGAADDAIQGPRPGSGSLRFARDDEAASLAQALEACGAVSTRAEQAFEIATRNRWLLHIALDHLTLARAARYAAILRGETPDGAHVEAAVEGLCDAGQKDYVPRGLLTRALYRAVAGDFSGAAADLDEAFEIAERGPMRLHLADIHLTRARLFGLYEKRPASYPWESATADLAEARRLIDVCGYGRRTEELEDAEAALAALGA